LIKPLLFCIFAGLLFQARGVFAQISKPAAPDSSGRTQKISPPDKWLDKDKFDHALMSAGLVAAQFYFLHQELDVNTAKSRQIAAGGALALGLAKEIYDQASGRGTPSWKDVLADVVGIGVAVMLITK
jgi:uncharacterized protein YfiM (DUF2279 family)